jgi:uncharacterized oxidoreductase
VKMRGKTIFITGGGSGIGRGLAEAFHKRGNRVIIAGRREGPLREVCAANAGMSWFALDVTHGDRLRSVAAQVTTQFPELNCVIANAGIQQVHDFAADKAVDEDSIEQEIATNLLGMIRVCAAFLPHLRKQPAATLINVSSALAFVPIAMIPVYCATKAAVHSFTVSLRHQLKDSKVEVIELVPPYVATDLNRALAGRIPATSGDTPMPLNEFIAKMMEELATASEEAAVGFAKSTLAASWTVASRAIFAKLNSAHTSRD